MLARPPSEISIRHIVEGLEGPASEWFAGVGGEVGEAHGPDFVWATLAESIGDLLGESTLDAMCRDAAQRGVPHADAASRMYFI